jgi:transposase InsO family protein
MPFHEVSRMDARLEFVMLASAEGGNVRQLCGRFGISPTTGYKWLERWRTAGMAGLQEESRRPQHSPSRSAAATEDAVLSLRTEHPAWGGRKIARRLKDLGHKEVPAPSTVTAILKRRGVELGTFGGGHCAFTRFERTRPNELWQMDFKGHVALQAGRLHPLTVLDDHSRFSVVLSACADERTETVKQQLVIAFRRYGLPEQLITDNGSPWGDGPGSPFTPLGVWLIEHGIRISHSRPYHPQTMGKDERFHRSLKAEVLSGPSFADLAAADRAFERWRTVYNTQRPHEALELAVPASRYQPSPRDYVETCPSNMLPATSCDASSRVVASASRGAPSDSPRPSTARQSPSGQPLRMASSTSSSEIRRLRTSTSGPSTTGPKVSTMSPNTRPPSPRSEQEGRVHQAACPMLAASAAARCMPFDISLVTALCSSTAAAVDVTYSLTLWIAFLMVSRAVRTSPEIPFRLPISCSILSVACLA